MSRRGKIARLPCAVRDELNQRLQDGEQGTRLIEWLNGRPDVQAVLKTDFGGHPITGNNLSEWKRGGFEEWLRQKEAFDLASGILEEAGDREALVKDGKLATCVAEMAVLSLARLLRATTRMEEGKEQRRTILRASREVVRLRASDRSYEDALRKKELYERSAALIPFQPGAAGSGDPALHQSVVAAKPAAAPKIPGEYGLIRPNTSRGGLGQIFETEKSTAEPQPEQDKRP